MTIAKNPSAGRQKRQRPELIKQKLLEAAVNVVGQEGYLSSTIAKITSAARVSHGTFYNYFESQQELFDELLPHLGGLLLREITDAIGNERDFWLREEIGFRTFFRFVQTYPQFYRILNEAEIFAERGYQQHITNMVGGYIRAVRRGIKEGVLRQLSDEETEAVVLILLAARNYLCMRYALTGPLPDFITSTYLELVRGGLGTQGAASGVMPPPPAPVSNSTEARQAGAIWNVSRQRGGYGTRAAATGAVAHGFAASDLAEATSAFVEFARLAVALVAEVDRDSVAVVGVNVALGGAAAAAFAPIRADLVAVSETVWTIQISVSDSEGGTAAHGTCVAKTTVRTA